MSDRTWHTTETAADHVNCHPQTVRKALASGDLHGRQRTAKGHWRIHVECLDAWAAGDKCEHQRLRRRSA